MELYVDNRSSQPDEMVVEALRRAVPFYEHRPDAGILFPLFEAWREGGVWVVTDYEEV